MSVQLNPRVSISNRLERLQDTTYLMKLCGLIYVAAILEIVDMTGIAFLLPVLGKFWSLQPTALGYLASTTFVGMFFGSFVCGMLADRFGRKPVIIAAMLIWGVAGVIFAFSWNVETLYISRFFIGIGFGAQVPLAVTLLSEMVPSHLRGKYITFFMMLLPLGVSITGLITYLLLPYWGWRGMFLLEALFSVWALVVWKYFPESALWLESRSRYSEADSTMSKIEEAIVKSTGRPLLPIEDKPVSASKKETVNKSFSELFTKSYIKITIMNAIWMITNMMGFYGIGIWLNSLLVAKGFSIIKSTGYVSLIALGGVPAYFLIRYLVDKIGRKWPVVLMAFMTAGTAYFYGQATTLAMVIATGLLFMFAQYGYNMVTMVYIPELFPTHMRVTGTGFTMACGRIGATLGPVVIGYIIAMYGSQTVMIFAFAINLLGGLVVAVLGPETKGKVF
ncbi:MAG: arabinose ABC transporter permease [Desulfosporosinus sp. BRH_c37]|nr:MAG: arabinose ABC transporter permease [Desulfosporosinus sp. BRH_c37]